MYCVPSTAAPQKLLAFRKDAIEIEKEAKRVSSGTILDFSEVHFISRAFADELLNVLDRLKKEGHKIQLRKMRPALKGHIKTVEKTRREIKKELSEKR